MAAHARPLLLLNSTFDTKPQTTYQGFQVTAGYRRKVFETGYAGSIPVALSKGLRKVVEHRFDRPRHVAAKC